jgi:hypothetical protein
MAQYILCIRHGQREFNMSYRAMIDYIASTKTASFRVILFDVPGISDG